MKSAQILNLYPTAPLSYELLNFIDNHKDFEDSLKISHYPRFIFVPRIMLSYPEHFNDELIGMFYYDTQEKLYKQDYVVNIDFQHKEFVSYSRFSKDIHETAYSKGIDTFFKKYGKWDGVKGEFYCKNNHKRPWMHHYRFDELPDDTFKNVARTILESHKINV